MDRLTTLKNVIGERKQNQIGNERSGPTRKRCQLCGKLFEPFNQLHKRRVSCLELSGRVPPNRAGTEFGAHSIYTISAGGARSYFRRIRAQCTAIAAARKATAIQMIHLPTLQFRIVRSSLPFTEVAVPGRPGAR